MFQVGGVRSSFGRIPVELHYHQSRPGTRRPRILCYGDSNTAGFCAGGARFEPYGKSLSRELASAGIPSDVVLCGLNGMTTTQMIEHLQSSVVKDPVGCIGKGLERILLEEGDQDLVIIMSGTNDLGKGGRAEGIVQLLSSLHQVCHKRSIPTFAVAPPTVLNGPLRLERDRLAKLICGWSNSCAHIEDSMDCEMLVPRMASRGFWESDQLHMTPAGSRELGRRLAPSVLSYLRRPGQDSCPTHRSHVSNASAVPLSIPVAGGVSVVVPVGSPAGSPQHLATSRVTRLKVGQTMEYYSVTVKRWILCQIVDIDTNGHVQVDCKAGYYMSHEEQAIKLRHPQAAATQPEAAGAGGVAVYVAEDTSPARRLARDVRFGEASQAALAVVRKDSDQISHWSDSDPGRRKDSDHIVVLRRDSDHTMPELRPVTQPGAWSAKYSIGEQVEYHSKSNGGWVLAVVTAVDITTGHVELDVKPGYMVSIEEQATKMRPPRELDRGLIEYYSRNVSHRSTGTMGRSMSL